MLRLLILLSLCFSSFTHANANNIFERKGITLIKPDGWHWLGYKALRENSAVKLEKTGIPRPVITITKHKEPYNDVNSSMIVNKIELETKENASNSYAVYRLELIKKRLGDDSIISTPKRIEVNGKAGTTFRYKDRFSVGGKEYQSFNEVTIIDIEPKVMLLISTSQPTTTSPKFADLDTLNDAIQKMTFKKSKL